MIYTANNNPNKLLIDVMGKIVPFAKSYNDKTGELEVYVTATLPGSSDKKEYSIAVTGNHVSNSDGLNEALVATAIIKGATIVDKKEFLNRQQPVMFGEQNDSK